MNVFKKAFDFLSKQKNCEPKQFLKSSNKIYSFLEKKSNKTYISQISHDKWTVKEIPEKYGIPHISYKLIILSKNTQQISPYWQSINPNTQLQKKKKNPQIL